MSDSETPQTAEPTDHRTQLEEALVEVKRVIAGQDEMLERVLVCLVAGGHLLIEGVPGLAKTLTIKTTAAVLGGTLPARPVHAGPRAERPRRHAHLPPDTGGFDTEEGPVFCNFLLADEINRAPAKVQSALLEVMQERQVTIGHDTHLVPDPFLVMATQNPIESEGTYPLPEAQVDRFMLKVVVGYPTRDEELTVVQRSLVAGRVRAAGARARVPQGPAAGRARTSTSTPRSSPTPSRSPRRRANPATVGLADLAGLRRVRRQPARPDRARPERPRARPRSTDATTSSAPTSARSPRTRCGTGSCSPTARSPSSGRADDVLDRCCSAVAAPPLELGRPVAA